MIVKMKKIAVCIKANETDAALDKLRKLGMLHIMTPKKESRETEIILEQISRYSQAKTILENVAPDGDSAEGLAAYRDLDELVTRVLDLDNEISDFHERLRELNRMDRFFEQWGGFDPQVLQDLKESGVHLTLALVKEEELPEDVRYITVRREKKRRLIMAVRDKASEELSFETLAVPEMGPEAIKQERASIDMKIEVIFQHYRSLSDASGPLGKMLHDMSSSMEFEEVKNGMNNEGEVLWLTGFAPDEDVPSMVNAAMRNNWALLIDDPSSEEPVPTKLKNNPFVRLIEPIFQVLGTVPGYREYDISGLFLIFFALFVAMIIGDAGYGMLFLIGSVLMHRKEGRITRLTGLLYLLSSTTVIWGALTGTWFGSESIASWGIFNMLMIPGLASFPSVAGVETLITQQNVMYFCFIIGTLQLSIACLMNFRRDFPKLVSYSHIGWLVMIIGLYFLVLNLVLGFDLPLWSIYAIAIGFSLIIVFSGQQEGVSFSRGLFKGIGGLFTTFLDSISTFSNIISYIRLFAVGMASVAISSSFNSMAAPMFGGILIPAALLILLIGHGLNIVMALLSVFVHGIRLNMLEFSGQLGMEWTGFSYTPFGEKDLS